MSGSEPPIAEEELHAYVDGQLAPSRAAAVRRYLDANPAEANRVAAWSAQREALRALLAPIAAQPLPPELNLARLIEQRLRRRHMPWAAAAAVVLALLAGGAGGWFAHMPATPSRLTLAMTLLKDEALASHIVYAADKRHPVEVLADQRDHLAQWLSNRLQRKVAPPDLTSVGFSLVGGRLLATERGGAAALFMYENAQGERLTVIFRPMVPSMHAPPDELAGDGVNGCAWIADGLGYAVAASLPDTELNKVAAQIRAERSG